MRVDVALGIGVGLVADVGGESVVNAATITTTMKITSKPPHPTPPHLRMLLAPLRPFVSDTPH